MHPRPTCLVTLLTVCACAGTSKPGPTEWEPEAAATAPGDAAVERAPRDLYAELVASQGGATHPVEALPGEVRCYHGELSIGGTRDDGSAWANRYEVFVRRAVDTSAGTIIEDYAQLYPDEVGSASAPDGVTDASVSRFVTTTALGDAPSDVIERHDWWEGRARSSADGASSAMVVWWVPDGPLLVRSRRVTAAGLELLEWSLYPGETQAEFTPSSLVDGSPLEDLMEPLTADQRARMGLHAYATSTLPALTDDECAEVFSHLPPAAPPRW